MEAYATAGLKTRATNGKRQTANGKQQTANRLRARLVPSVRQGALRRDHRARRFSGLCRLRRRDADATDADAARIADAGDRGRHGESAEQHAKVVAGSRLSGASVVDARPVCQRTEDVNQYP